MELSAYSIKKYLLIFGAPPAPELNSSNPGSMALVNAMPTAVAAIKIIPSEIRNLRFDCLGIFESPEWTCVIPGGRGSVRAHSDAGSDGASPSQVHLPRFSGSRKVV